MNGENDLKTDFMGIIKKTLSDCGAPIAHIQVDMNVAYRKGEGGGIGFCIPGKGMYFREGEARANMEEGDMVYLISVQRIE